MAAEVSSLRRILNGGDGTDQSGKPTAMITRDFLGGRSNLLDFKELDLDMHVPSGWEKRLDLKSGKVYVQKKESMISASSKSSEKKVNAAAGGATKLQDLNFPPTSTPKPPYNIPSSDNTASLNLNLVLFPSSSSATTSPPPPPPASSSSSVFNSVCTLDKVKFALERAERETNNTKQRRSSMSKRTSSPTSPSRSSSSVIDYYEIMVGEEEDNRSTFATGCPNCLIYVLVSRNDPKCPRCCSIVPSPPGALLKKPRIDLNISL